MGNPSAYGGKLKLNKKLSPQQKNELDTYLKDTSNEDLNQHCQYAYSFWKAEDNQTLIIDDPEEDSHPNEFNVLKHLIKKFFIPWDIQLRGVISIERRYDYVDNAIMFIKENKYLEIETFDPSNFEILLDQITIP
jgi:hypothetical protein